MQIGQVIRQYRKKKDMTQEVRYFSGYAVIFSGGTDEGRDTGHRLYDEYYAEREIYR